MKISIAGAAATIISLWTVKITSVAPVEMAGRQITPVRALGTWSLIWVCLRTSCIFLCSDRCLIVKIPRVNALWVAIWLHKPNLKVVRNTFQKQLDSWKCIFLLMFCFGVFCLQLLRHCIWFPEANSQINPSFGKILNKFRQTLFADLMLSLCKSTFSLAKTQFCAEMLLCLQLNCKQAAEERQMRMWTTMNSCAEWPTMDLSDQLFHWLLIFLLQHLMNDPSFYRISQKNQQFCECSKKKTTRSADL